MVCPSMKLIIFTLMSVFQLYHTSCCCCFSTGTLQGDKCSRTGLCRYHPTAQLHLGSLREPWVTLLLHLYWRGCLIIHVSVELAGSYLEHVPCKFWKVCLGLKYLPQINYGGKLTCLDVVHASVITDVLRDGLAVHCFRAALCAAVIWMLL